MENSAQAKFGEKLNLSFTEAFNQVVSGFSERSQAIIKARYGIDSGKPKTLEEIGRENKITRERVRQIIQEILKKSRSMKDNSLIVEMEQKITFTIEKKSGIIEKNRLVSETGKNDLNEMAAVKFFLDCLGSFTGIEIKDELKKSYVLSGFSLSEWKKIKNEAKKILDVAKTVMTPDELGSNISKSLKVKINSKLFDWLEVSNEIKRNNFGKWGLTDWGEISPKSTREKAHLVLKEAKEPLHFHKIAELIDKYKLNKKKTHPQTVHNELIKDDRFVLVGRGTYALSFWGYKRGTVKEVLEEILKNSPEPMKRENILSEVMKIRQVKKSTIMINLNNFFARVGRDEYTLGK